VSVSLSLPLYLFPPPSTHSRMLLPHNFKANIYLSLICSFTLIVPSVNTSLSSPICAISQVYSCFLLSRCEGLGFACDRSGHSVTGTGFSPNLHFPVHIIPPAAPYSLTYDMGGMDSGSVSGCGFTETQSHPIVTVIEGSAGAVFTVDWKVVR
jgi:hypothetical protein